MSLEKLLISDLSLEACKQKKCYEGYIKYFKITNGCKLEPNGYTLPNSRKGKALNDQ